MERADPAASRRNEEERRALRTRLDQLKAKHAAGKRSATEVLADRSREQADARRLSPGPTSRQSRVKKAAKTLAAALSGTEPGDGGASSPDEDEDDEDDPLGGPGARLRTKRAAYRKIATRDPGRLLQAGLKQFRDHIIFDGCDRRGSIASRRQTTQEIGAADDANM